MRRRSPRPIPPALVACGLLLAAAGYAVAAPELPWRSGDVPIPGGGADLGSLEPLPAGGRSVELRATPASRGTDAADPVGPDTAARVPGPRATVTAAGRALIALTCPSADRCAIAVTVDVGTGLRPRPGGYVEARHGRRLVIGRRKARIRRGRVTRVAVPVSAAARDALARLGRLPVRISVVTTRVDGTRALTHAHVVLRAPGAGTPAP